MVRDTFYRKHQIQKRLMLTVLSIITLASQACLKLFKVVFKFTSHSNIRLYNNNSSNTSRNKCSQFSFSQLLWYSHSSSKCITHISRPSSNNYTTSSYSNRDHRLSQCRSVHTITNQWYTHINQYKSKMFRVSTKATEDTYKINTQIRCSNSQHHRSKTKDSDLKDGFQGRPKKANLRNLI
jgi:capsular polysaccharide biosynthesis protein